MFVFFNRISRPSCAYYDNLTIVKGKSVAANYSIIFYNYGYTLCVKIISFASSYESVVYPTDLSVRREISTDHFILIFRSPLLQG